MKKGLLIAALIVLIGAGSSASATPYLYTDRGTIYRLNKGYTYGASYIVFDSSVWIDGGVYAGRAFVFFNPEDRALKIIAFSHQANYYKAHNIECHWTGDGTYAKGFRNEDSGSFSQFDVLLFYGSTGASAVTELFCP